MFNVCWNTKYIIFNIVNLAQSNSNPQLVEIIKKKDNFYNK